MDYDLCAIFLSARNLVEFYLVQEMKGKTVTTIMYRIEFKRKLKYSFVSVEFAHTEKSIRNLIKSNRNHIAFIIFRLIWNQTEFRLVTNHSENDNYNLISF